MESSQEKRLALSLQWVYSCGLLCGGCRKTEPQGIL